MANDGLLPPSRLGTVLAIWAHPDDETYLAAGLMVAARVANHRVVCVAATAGERGTDDGATWPPERLGRVRRWEAAAAMAVLGVREHLVLGLPDGALVDHADAGTRMVGDLIDEVDPDTIVTFGPDGMTFHPDHIAVHEWVTTAWRRRQHRARLLYATATTDFVERFRADFEAWGAYMTDERPTGVPAEELAVHVELQGPALDQKLTALRALATQTSALMAAVDPATYAAQVAEEAFIDATALGFTGASASTNGVARLRR
jgi:LmbE family N-acetylglucosaminyl deacetylase